jgi:hypothetical protein
MSILTDIQINTNVVLSYSADLFSRKGATLSLGTISFLLGFRECRSFICAYEWLEGDITGAIPEAEC